MLMAKLRHLGAEAGRRRAVAELLDQFDLVEAADKPLLTYSGGMKRRLDLAMTLVATPSILFLDEPTTGLDPRSRHTMWDIVRGIVADGTSVLLTTQYLDEADELANRIAVLDHGTIVAEGTPDELKRRVGAQKGGGGHLKLQFADGPALDRAAKLFDGSTKNAAALHASRSRQTVASAPCATRSTAWTAQASRSPTSPSTPPTSTTCSSPSPGAPPSRRTNRHRRSSIMTTARRNQAGVHPLRT